MTKEQALQKVTDYCTEKAYTSETLTDGFKDKFAEHFAKRFPDADADDENAIAEMKFALNSAFSGASLIITEKTNAFTSKENDYKNQIAELNKKLGTPTPPPPTVTIPKEVQEQLDELKKFKNEEAKKAKSKNILSIAKNNIREDLHRSFENYAKDFVVNLDEADEEQAKKLTARFQEIFKDSIGDIKPFKPQQTQKQEDEIIGKVKKVEI